MLIIRAIVPEGLLPIVNRGDWLSNRYSHGNSAREMLSRVGVFGLKMKEHSGFSEWIDFDCRYCSCVGECRKNYRVERRWFAERSPGVAWWHWFSANGAYQFHHLKLTSRKSVNKRFQRGYMSRAVSPRLEILRPPERGRRFRNGRTHFKHYVSTWDISLIF